MKIAFFSDNLYPEISGISDSILILGEELVKRGHEVAYVGPSYSKKNYSITKSPLDNESASRLSKFKVFRIPAFSLPGSITGQSRIAIPFGFSRKFIKEFAPHIIHVQSPFGVGLEAYFSAKKLKIPIVGTNHTPPEEFFPSFFKRYYAWFYNLCLYVSTPSEELLSSMKTSGFKKSGRSLPNPILLDRFSPGTHEEKARIKKELNIYGPVILYTGRLSAEKHVDVIIKALKNLPSNVTFIITGHGKARDALGKLATSLSLEKRVIFTGYFELSRLVELYKIADVFSIMSTAETQSLSLMQAFASGVPAVCARAHGLSEYVKPDCGFLVDYDDERKLAEYIMILLSDHELRSKMGKAGTEYVKKFAPAEVAITWEEIYKNNISNI